MPKQKPYNADHELAGLVLMVEQLLALEEKLEQSSNNNAGLRHNINMQKRDLKIACAQYHHLNKQQVVKHRQQYTTQELNWSR